MMETRLSGEVLHVLGELLGDPDRLRPVAVMPIGVPDESPPPKERKSLSDIVSWEKFGKSK